jgi:hypothetical protein
MNKGFVAIVDKNFVNLAEVFIDSLLAFSDYKIDLFGLNIDIPFDRPNMIKHRLNWEDYGCPTKGKGRVAITISKWRALMRSNFDTRCLIDVDSVATRFVDSIFSHSVNNRYPVFFQHPHVKTIKGDKKERLEYMNDFFGTNVEQTCMYCHSSPSVWTLKNSSFLEDCYDTHLRLQKNNYGIGDEFVNNYVLWKNKGTCIEEIANYDRLKLDLFFTKKPTNCCFIHGEKDSIMASNILRRIKDED